MSRLPSIVQEVNGTSTTKFRVHLKNGRTVNLEGIVDPMDLGAEVLGEALASGRIVEHLVTPDAQINWALARGKAEDVPELMTSWAEAVGIGKRGLSLLVSVYEKTDLVEADLQMFYRVDLADWFRPGPGHMSTRRLVVLLLGIEFRTESLFWSSMGELDPMSRTDILLAQIAGGMSNKTHSFLTAKKDRADRAEQNVKMERIMARRAAIEEK